MKYSWVVSQAENEEKLATFIKAHLSEAKFSFRKIKSWIDAGLCSLNHRKEKFHHTTVRSGDIVELIVPEETKSPTSEIETLFEDEFLLVCNKPPGVICDERLEKRMGAFLVHRLDKDTSGVLLFAKSEDIRDRLFEDFRTRKVQKEYLAVVDGIIEKEHGTIDNYLCPVKKFQGQTIWGISKSHEGRHAVTDWKVVKRGACETVVMLYPYTGRTHQLRVHMKWLHHPILGDALYGSSYFSKYPAERVLLHAQKLTFLHPISNKKLEFTAKIPEDIQNICDT